MPAKEQFQKSIKDGYTFKGESIKIGRAVLEGEVIDGADVFLPLKTMNRHGLIAGATGTGKTKSLQLISEGLSDASVPVLLLDIKGDLSGIAAAGAPNDKIAERTKLLGTGYKPQAYSVESVLRGIFFFMALIVSGAPMYAVMIYQTFLILFTAFTHANIRLPKKIDHAISYLFVSPNMHKVHHHWEQPYTDSNYGAVFSIWDRLFGTYRELEPSQIRYGLDRYYPNEHDENFLMLLKKPFGKMKD